MIYVSQEPRGGGAIDLGPLEAAGEFRFVFPDWFSPSFDPIEAMQVARKALADFDFERDSLTTTGGDPLAPVMIGAALASLAREKGAGGFNWLRYERPKNGRPARYSPVRVPFQV